MREKKDKEKEVAALKAKCLELQMLRLGRTVDLDTFEACTINEEAENLKVS